MIAEVMSRKAPSSRSARFTMSMGEEFYPLNHQSASDSTAASGMARARPWRSHFGYETGEAAHHAPAAATPRNEKRIGRWTANTTTGAESSAKNSS
jgi:hypothetical protein